MLNIQADLTNICHYILLTLYGRIIPVSYTHLLFKYADEAYELLHDEFTPDKYDRIDVILENLRNYTVKHFSDEERYMESINYKKIFTQKVQHQEFIHKLDEFMEHHNDEVEDQDEQIMEILKYLTEWLVNHILYVDGQIPKG